MSKKQKIPSEAQAKYLAALFSQRSFSDVITIYDGGYNTATQMSLVKNGWVSETGTKGKSRTGLNYSKYAINDQGLLALEMYLFKARMKSSEAKL